jgi:H+/Cl- antiporter ClcA
LAVPGLPAYTEILPGDLFFGFVVAVVAAVVAVAARETAVLVDRVAARRAVPVLFGAAIVTALIVLIAQGGFDIDVNQILFSGNAGMSELIQQTSVSVVIVILVGKALAYAVALGGGFRGGPIFPATFLGVAAAVLVTLIIPDASVTPLAAAGIAASAGAMLKLPATSALLGAVLVSSGGADVAPFAIFGAIVGLIVRLAVDKKLGVRAAAGATTPTQASSSAQPTG